MSHDNKITFPNGLVGDIAEYIYGSAKKPLKEAALLAAIGLVAGISGRSYNISGTGLNQYLMLLAATGRGKEGMADGIDGIVDEVYKINDKIYDFYGASTFASGQALLKAVSKKPCFFSIWGEIGQTFKQMNDPKAPSYMVALKRVLLDLYSKSGGKKYLMPMVYADEEKNTKRVRAPNVTILCESNPTTLFENLSQSNISEGTIPRFITLEYNGDVKYLNDKNKINSKVPQLIVNGVADLVTKAIGSAMYDNYIDIEISKSAEDILDGFEHDCVDKMNGLPKNNSIIDLWNRAHLKALKLAGAIAVGINSNKPIVDDKTALWAINFIFNEVSHIASKIDGGFINDSSGNAQEQAIRKVINEYQKMSVQNRNEKWKVPTAIAEKNYLYTYSYIMLKVRYLSAFKNDKRGCTRAIKETLKDLVDSDVLRVVGRNDAMASSYKDDKRFSTVVYTTSTSW